MCWRRTKRQVIISLIEGQICIIMACIDEAGFTSKLLWMKLLEIIYNKLSPQPQPPYTHDTKLHESLY